jgi:hypothetical protein
MENTTDKVVRVAIEDILPDKDNMEVAVDSMRKGMYSNDTRPLEAYKIGDKYVLSDGHHRLLQAIVAGEAHVLVKVLESQVPISTNGTVKLNFLEGDYYGLDSSLENGWLINRL